MDPTQSLIMGHEQEESKAGNSKSPKKKITRSWKMRLIEGLGLTNYLVKNFVFRAPQTGYIFEEGVRLMFYPLLQNKKVDIYSPYLEIKSFILHSQQSKKVCYVPVIYLTRPEVMRRTPSATGSISNTRGIDDTIMSIKESLQTFSIKRSKSLMDVKVQEIKKKKPKKVPKKPKQPKPKISQPTVIQQPVEEVQIIPDIQYKLLIIYSHGNASDLGDVYFFAEKMVKEYDVDMLAYDYTGYGLGNNKYEVSEKQTYKDLQDILSFAVVHLNYSLNQIVLWGFSLGSGPTIEIASRFTSLGGVVLQAPLASMLLWLESDKNQISSSDADIYSSINKIQAIKCKIMLMHGDKDSVINIRHSHLLFDKYTQINEDHTNIQLILIKNHDHNDLQEVIENADSLLGKKIYRFFREIQLQNNFHYQCDIEEDVMNNKLEIESRETGLLHLLSDDYKVNRTRVETNPPKEKISQIPQNKIQILPVDELQEIIEATPKQRRQNTLNYLSKLKPRASSATRKSIGQDQGKKGIFKICMCSAQEI